MSSDSDGSDIVVPTSIRPSLRRDSRPSPSKQVSPIVTQAARRQLRGNKGEKRSAAEVASELRAKVAVPGL
jgi:hypothetical protein